MEGKSPIETTEADKIKQRISSKPLSTKGGWIWASSEIDDLRERISAAFDFMETRTRGINLSAKPKEPPAGIDHLEEGLEEELRKGMVDLEQERAEGSHHPDLEFRPKESPLHGIAPEPSKA